MDAMGSRHLCSRLMPSEGERCAAGLWGLDRIDRRPPAREYSYSYQYDGTGIHIYVVDTVRLNRSSCFDVQSFYIRTGVTYSYRGYLIHL